MLSEGITYKTVFPGEITQALRWVETPQIVTGGKLFVMTCEKKVRKDSDMRHEDRIVAFDMRLKRQ